MYVVGKLCGIEVCLLSVEATPAVYVKIAEFFALYFKFNIYLALICPNNYWDILEIIDFSHLKDICYAMLMAIK